jgi:hypothetical protein
MKKEEKKRQWNITLRDFRISIVLTCIIIGLACCVTASAQSAAKIPDKFTVSFISTGQGVDHKAEDRFRDLIAKFQQEHKTGMLYQMSHWGKEGETDYNFNVSRLPAQLKQSLKEKITKMFEDNALVRIQDSPNH